MGDNGDIAQFHAIISLYGGMAYIEHWAICRHILSTSSNIDLPAKGKLMNIVLMDHLVMTVRDIKRTLNFYCAILGMKKVEFGEGRIALAFGPHKINLHEAGNEYKPNAIKASLGSMDLCLIVQEDIEEVAGQLARSGVELIAGPVERTGARGPIRSIYVRDPDGNLIELSNYTNEAKVSAMFMEDEGANIQTQEKTQEKHEIADAISTTWLESEE
jgi:catechol 2,3-dioxygenase-like lactoylglutathione lyase family enzyme